MIFLGSKCPPTERETLEIDVLFVGAGPASLAGAYHLARLLARHNASASRKLELSIAVLEKGAEIGSHALSGAIVDPRALRELFPEDFDAIPFEARGREGARLVAHRDEARAPLPEPPPLEQPRQLRRLARQAGQVDGGQRSRRAGVDVFCEFPGARCCR